MYFVQKTVDGKCLENSDLLPQRVEQLGLFLKFKLSVELSDGKETVRKALVVVEEICHLVDHVSSGISRLEHLLQHKAPVVSVCLRHKIGLILGEVDEILQPIEGFLEQDLFIVIVHRLVHLSFPLHYGGLLFERLE